MAVEIHLSGILFSFPVPHGNFYDWDFGKLRAAPGQLGLEFGDAAFFGGLVEINGDGVVNRHGHFRLVAPFVRLAIAKPERRGGGVRWIVFYDFRLDDSTLVLRDVNVGVAVPHRTLNKAGRNVRIGFDFSTTHGLTKPGMFFLPAVDGLFLNPKEIGDLRVRTFQQAEPINLIVELGFEVRGPAALVFP